MSSKSTKSNRMARFVGGPFGGRKFDLGNQYGMNEVTYRGPKKLTRRQRYDMLRAQTMYAQSSIMLESTSVSATYRLAVRHQQVGNMVNRVMCMHPDGSLFYEYVEGSKRD